MSVVELEIDIDDPFYADQDFSVLEVFEKNKSYFNDWKDILEKRIDILERISRLLEKHKHDHGEFYPLRKDTFRALMMCPLDKVKVVIWGQDPYPTLLKNGLPRAQGYSFGVSKHDTVPQSLKNIYKEIKSEYPEFQIPSHGDLSKLSEQGVLFMNTALTYCSRSGCSAHRKGVWSPFTNLIIKTLNENVKDCIHILWGSDAQKLQESIKSNYKFVSAHPSPFSAYRGFFGNKHFLKTNIALKRIGKEPIDWKKI